MQLRIHWAWRLGVPLVLGLIFFDLWKEVQVLGMLTTEGWILAVSAAIGAVGGLPILLTMRLSLHPDHARVRWGFGRAGMDYTVPFDSVVSVQLVEGFPKLRWLPPTVFLIQGRIGRSLHWRTGTASPFPLGSLLKDHQQALLYVLERVDPDVVEPAVWEFAEKYRRKGFLPPRPRYAPAG